MLYAKKFNTEGYSIAPNKHFLPPTNYYFLKSTP